MSKQLLTAVSIGLVGLSVVNTADAALSSRLGGQAYYDDVLDITWLADANYAKTSGFDSDGRLSWGDANNWAASLNIDGVVGWRLPTMVDTDDPGCDFSHMGTDCGLNVLTGSAATTVYSEMASMYYDTLGNLAVVNLQNGGGLVNTGPFSNIRDHKYYWTDLVFAPNNDRAWDFSMNTGVQTRHTKNHATGSGSLWYAWAVHSGDVTVSAVPVPSAVWLFCSGLIGLIGFTRCRKV